jgi:hypothetical protein
MWRLAKTLGKTIEWLETNLSPERLAYYVCHLAIDSEPPPDHNLPPEAVDQNLSAYNEMVKGFTDKMNRFASMNQDDDG